MRVAGPSTPLDTILGSGATLAHVEWGYLLFDSPRNHLFGHFMRKTVHSVQFQELRRSKFELESITIR